MRKDYVKYYCDFCEQEVKRDTEGLPCKICVSLLEQALYRKSHYYENRFYNCIILTPPRFQYAWLGDKKAWWAMKNCFRLLAKRAGLQNDKGIHIID